MRWRSRRRSAQPSRWSRLHASLATREKVGRTLLAVDRARSQMLAYVRRSELMSWPPRRSVADELLMAPPDLRVADPSFVDELRVGNFGLAGEIADHRNYQVLAVQIANEFIVFFRRQEIPQLSVLIGLLDKLLQTGEPSAPRSFHPVRDFQAVVAKVFVHIIQA